MASMIDTDDSIDVRWIKPRGWRAQTQWLVLKPFSVMGFTIPKGFTSDGATVPLFLRWLFPPTDRYFAEAILHDWLLKQHLVSRESADELFNDALAHCDISRTRRWAMYQAVKWNTWRQSL